MSHILTIFRNSRAPGKVSIPGSLTLVVAILLLSGALVSSAAQTIEYEVTGLGTFGISDEFRMANAFSINDSDVIVGRCASTTVAERACMWENGEASGLGELAGGSVRGWANDITTDGHIVGVSYDAAGARAVEWLPGNPRVLSVISEFGTKSYALGINDDEIIVGRNDLGFGPWLLDGGTVLGLDVLPGNQGDLGQAEEISEDGLTVGGVRDPVGNPHMNFAVIWNLLGDATDLGKAPGSTEATARSINSAHTVVGESWFGDNQQGGKRLATVWTPNGTPFSYTAALLPGIAGLGGHSAPPGINDAGDIVGWIQETDGADPHAVLWRGPAPYAAVDLNELIDPASGWYLRAAADVNESGVIVGQGFNPAGDLEAFMLTPVSGQADTDGDGILDVSDNCPAIPNTDQNDSDMDSLGDICDNDDDNDGVLDGSDNCQFTSNPDQIDLDSDSLGDPCDVDRDGDGVCDGPDAAPGCTAGPDNCADAPNAPQTDTDIDGQGDACDGDDDNDGVIDDSDNCPTVTNAGQADLDGDNIGDDCDADVDGDGAANGSDNCPATPNPSQDDTDGDGDGDACDADDDNDGHLDGGDNCPLVPNAAQADTDGDGAGDACDTDNDGDGAGNGVDNCPNVPNSDQNDFDGDGQGDACDADIDGDGISNPSDLCAGTPLGTVVDPGTGCSIEQLVPCDGPRGTSVPWKNHGKYLSHVAKSTKSFVQMGLITDEQRSDLISQAAQSSCGGN